MLGYALFSVNKKAKNYRDMKRRYHHSQDSYGNEFRYEQKEKAYYQMKDIMLSIIQPICIHKVPRHCYTRIESSDDEYDTDCDDYYDDSSDEFIDITIVEYNYFLFYKIKNYFSTHPFMKRK